MLLICKWLIHYITLQNYNNIMMIFFQDHSCFDVVAWHGNYAPYMYDLTKFMVINAVEFDHAVSTLT